MLRSPGGACHVLGWGLAFLLLPASGHAQSVESFYRGKTLSMVIGYPTGGSNDIYARSVARHIGKHIPGNPTVVPRNMPGGGSLVAANHIFNVAPKDGTVLGTIDLGGVPEQGVPDGKGLLYVVMQDPQGSVTVVDVKTMKAVAQIGTAARPMTMNGHGLRSGRYTVLTSGTVSVMNSGNTMTTTAP